MRLSTPVEAAKPPRPIRLGDTLLALGSCFAATVGERWCAAGLPGACNPCGPLFNPESLATLIELCANPPPRHELEQSLRWHDGLWHSLLFHGDFSDPDSQHALDRMQQALATSGEHLARADWLLLTWGNAQVWRHQSDPERVVSNCHQLPAAEFTTDILDSNTILARYASLVRELIRRRPGRHIILTISPIRHLGHGAERNSLAKAQLITAAHQLRQTFPQHLTLFPAYEILLDELRDYRFYAEDLCHPAPLAAEIIWERFQTSCAEPALRDFLGRAAAIERRQHHRLRFPASPAARAWQAETEQLSQNLRLELQQALRNRTTACADAP